MKGHRPRVGNDITDLMKDQLRIIRWLQTLGLLKNFARCTGCRKGMKLIKRNRSIDGYTW